jgi:hypothetical protein
MDVISRYGTPKLILYELSGAKKFFGACIKGEVMGGRELTGWKVPRLFRASLFPSRIIGY